MTHLSETEAMKKIREILGIKKLEKTKQAAIMKALAEVYKDGFAAGDYMRCMIEHVKF